VVISKCLRGGLWTWAGQGGAGGGQMHAPGQEKTHIHLPVRLACGADGRGHLNLHRVGVVAADVTKVCLEPSLCLGLPVRGPRDGGARPVEPRPVFADLRTPRDGRRCILRGRRRCWDREEKQGEGERGLTSYALFFDTSSKHGTSSPMWPVHASFSCLLIGIARAATPSKRKAAAVKSRIFCLGFS